MPVSRHALKVVVAALAALAMTAQAQAATCWKPAEIGAARTNQLRTMMLVVSLRCKAGGINFHAAYERFLTSHAASLQEAQAELQAHFGAGQSREGKRALDSYLTDVANGYGSGRTDMVTCRSFEAVASELASAVENRDMLASIAMDMVRDPLLDAPRCPQVVRKP